MRAAALAAAALALPALLRLVRRSPPPLPIPWGRAHRYVWRGHTVTFQQAGDGAPLLLLHSLGPGHDGAEWRGVAERLAARFRVLVPDLPGWGRSALLERTPTAELYRDFVGDFLAEVVREPAPVVAAGGSAPFAAAAASALPEAVRLLGVVTPRGLGGSPRPQLWPRLLDLPVLGAPAFALATSRIAVERHLRSRLDRPEVVDAGRLAHHLRSCRRPGADRALIAWWQGRLDADAAPALAQLGAPLWIAWGRLAQRPPVGDADLWLRLVPAARVDVFEGCGDLPHVEHAGLFCRAFEQQLGALPDSVRTA
ncbi:MAG TPA: hypothetical protein VMT16_01795 [Thermoanaerobaculia bacterium]|nr:hypothetical protein [Thermoanaerobaculia bacterium]